jgi:hypothetical protein
MTWADYREKAKKAKVHIGFNINQSIPSKISLTHGKGDERPFVDKDCNKRTDTLLSRDTTLCHKNFDNWLRRRDSHLYVGYVKQAEKRL